MTDTDQSTIAAPPVSIEAFTLARPALCWNHAASSTTSNAGAMAATSSHRWICKGCRAQRAPTRTCTAA